MVCACHAIIERLKIQHSIVNFLFLKDVTLKRHSYFLYFLLYLLYSMVVVGSSLGIMFKIFSKIKDGLKKTKDNMVGKISGILKKFTKIDEEFFLELEEILISADVGVETTEKICDSLEDVVRKEKLKDANEIKESLKKILVQILEENGEVEKGEITYPHAILVVGVNGVGKTTTIGKLASLYKKNGKTVLLSAADTFRAAAIDQLEIWATRVGVTIIKQKEGSDPAAVAFDSINSAKARKVEYIIFDTAGRLHNKKNLMDELSKINRVIEKGLPGSFIETLLVVDATTGQNAISQVKEFKKIANITGLVLTKLDGTAKGGIVLAIKNELKIPIKYVGMGEKLDDISEFDAKEFVDALFEE